MKAHLEERQDQITFERHHILIHDDCPHTTGDPNLFISPYETTDGSAQCLGCLAKMTRRQYEKYRA